MSKGSRNKYPRIMIYLAMFGTYFGAGPKILTYY